jgi:putative phosphoribosyl transferase
MVFKDRYDAAMKMLPLLSKYRHEEGVVLAVPRGGVPIGYYIAKEYNFPLELLLTKKIGLPGNPELAIGAVSMENEVIDDRFEISREYIAGEITRIRKSLQERYKKFMGDRQPADLKGKTVIIADDGIATGNTMIASIKMIRAMNPGKIVVAVPVAPYPTAEKIRDLVDDFICAYIPEDFFGVGQFYDDFSQVTDGEVIQFLKRINEELKAKEA